MMDWKNIGETAFKLGFDVALPVADLITDVVFTISVYKDETYFSTILTYFEASGNFALFNILISNIL